MGDYEDGTLAELYARIVEGIPAGATMPFLELQMVISDALWDTLENDE